jgi:hypothetical protein
MSLPAGRTDGTTHPSYRDNYCSDIILYETDAVAVNVFALSRIISPIHTERASH